MKENKIFKEIEDKIRYLNKDQEQYRIVDICGNRVDAVFTTSEEQDILDMIDSGLTVDQIVEEINKWNVTMSNILNNKNN